MTYSEITDNIIEIEIKKLYDLNKVGNFIDLVTYYHFKRCKHSNCSNCQFIDSITNIYITNFGNENAIKELQVFCGEYFGKFFSLTSLITLLAIIEKKRVELGRKKVQL